LALITYWHQAAGYGEPRGRPAATVGPGAARDTVRDTKVGVIVTSVRAGRPNAALTPIMDRTARAGTADYPAAPHTEVRLARL
jgi:hypothetical protein